MSISNCQPITASPRSLALQVTAVLRSALRAKRVPLSTIWTVGAVLKLGRMFGAWKRLLHPCVLL